MKIESVRIENFRSIKDQTILFDDYTCFVGSNGAGKSTVFHALNLFFRQYKDSKTDLSKLTKNDFHHNNTENEIKVTVTFKGLSKQAKEDLKDYFRNERLIVSAVARYDVISQKAEVKQYGSRLGIEDFRDFFEADKSGKKAPELKVIYADLKAKYPDLSSATTKDAMIKGLHDYETANSDKCILIPSEDQFYGVSKGTNKLSSHIQWVFVPAVKDAIEESEESKSSALGQLLARTVRSKVNFEEGLTELRAKAQKAYQEILESQQAVLNNLSTSLESKLKTWAHPSLTTKILWKQDAEKTIKVEEPFAYLQIGERGFEGDLSRFGHGLQRSYMLALLQELATIGDTDIPTLVMGIEEPELYQHPPQARHLSETLQDLSEKDAQVFVCTHSPLFIPGDKFENIRFVKEIGNPSYTTITSTTYENILGEYTKFDQVHYNEKGMMAKLFPTLNAVFNEIFFCQKVILVEGIEDVAYIYSYLMLTNTYPEFRKYGCHIVPVGGKSNLIRSLIISRLLEIPAFVVFDADTDTKSCHIEINKKENKAILAIQGHCDDNEWPMSNVYKSNCVYWAKNITKTIADDFGNKWQYYRDKAHLLYDNAGSLEKNPLAIAKSMELGWEDDVKSNSMILLVKKIIEFCKIKSSGKAN